jgi:hypothetical protein
MLVGLGVFWLSACSTVPFQEIELVAVAEANPQAVRECTDPRFGGGIVAD